MLRNPGRVSWIVPLILSAGLLSACDLLDPTEEGHRVLIESGTDTEIIVLPILPRPPGAIACPAGTGVGREEVLGPDGGTVRLDPPLTRRRIGIHAFPDAAASSAPFSIAEIPVTYPEVEGTAPQGRAIRITMTAQGCDFAGQLGVVRWDGREWNRLEEVVVTQDSVVSVELESASRYALGTF